MMSEKTMLKNVPAVPLAIRVASAARVRLTFDHVHIIGSVPDRQCDGLLVPLHQVHHHGLLLGGDPAADDGAALAGQVNEVLLPLFFFGLQPPLTLRAHPSLLFCPWELQLQNLTCLGLFL